VIMAYEERDSEVEAHLVDLNERRDISITRVIAPAEVPPHLVDRITPAEALTSLLEQTAVTKDAGMKQKLER
jgi:hypothetical protein